MILMEILSLDETGRILIPPSIQKQLELTPAISKLTIEIEGGKLILKPLITEPQVYYKNNVLVVESAPLNNPEEITTIIEQLREERLTELSW
jgi:bifunctional DNA-binding transcriptional regulator/antitoxin component of YhaV-PrlF toxin-antitoxin module